MVAIVSDVIDDKLNRLKADLANEIGETPRPQIGTASHDVQCVYDAAMGLRDNLALWPIEKKRAYCGAIDGDPITYLHQHYGEEKRAGLLYPAVLKDLDPRLHNAVEKRRAREAQSISDVYGHEHILLINRMREQLGDILGDDPAKFNRMISRLTYLKQPASKGDGAPDLFGR